MQCRFLPFHVPFSDTAVHTHTTFAPPHYASRTTFTTPYACLAPSPHVRHYTFHTIGTALSARSALWSTLSKNAADRQRREESPYPSSRPHVCICTEILFLVNSSKYPQRPSRADSDKSARTRRELTEIPQGWVSPCSLG